MTGDSAVLRYLNQALIERAGIQHYKQSQMGSAG
jgi:bacterioferritin (cytochrome b1)